MTVTNETAATLTELVARFDELEIGKRYPVAGNWCRYCGSEDLALDKRLRAVAGSLAGVQVKTPAASTLYLTCNGCGHESEGK